jgi:DNA-nicking Smr family endonuclease
MKPSYDDLDLKLWSIVTATVRPLHPARGHAGERVVSKEIVLASPQGVATLAAPTAAPTLVLAPAPVQRKSGPRRLAPVEDIEPSRRRRLDRGREPPAAAIDLHGLNQDQARATLTGFILRGWAEHRRTILVITGKGALGDGVLRRRVPEWLAEPPLRQIVAGLSEAHRRHGGEGALYVALKRAPAGQNPIAPTR